MFNDKTLLLRIINNAKLQESVEIDEEGKSISIYRGYSGFVMEFTFDDNGNLVDCGAYE